MNKDLSNSTSGYKYLSQRFKITSKTTLGELQRIRLILKTMSLRELILLKENLQGEVEGAKAGNTLVAGFAIYITVGSTSLTLIVNYVVKLQDQATKIAGGEVTVSWYIFFVSLILLLLGGIVMFCSIWLHARVKRTSILYSMINDICEKKLKETEIK